MKRNLVFLNLVASVVVTLLFFFLNVSFVVSIVIAVVLKNLSQALIPGILLMFFCLRALLPFAFLAGASIR